MIWEFCYNPSGNHANPNGEWIVLANTCDTPVNLAGYSISDNERHGTYRFGSDVELKPGEKIVLGALGRSR